MEVWHLDAGGAPGAVCGVTDGLWTLAAEQAAAGARVTVACRSDPAPWTPPRGVRAVPVPGVTGDPVGVLAAVHGGWPDVVHLHGVWEPRHVVAAARLWRAGVPFVVTPHGGLAVALRSRRPLVRSGWVRGVLGPWLDRAAAVLFLFEEEVDEATRLLGRPPARVRVVPFPVAADAPVSVDRAPAAEPTVLFLGRYDVFQKGLDRFVDLARLLPEVRFEAHGAPPAGGRALAEFRALAASAPPNVRFGAPVRGDAKAEVLARAWMYVQPSRFEGFPLAVAEALRAGVPVAGPEDLPFVRHLARHRAVAPLPVPAAAAARDLLDRLGRPARLASLGADGRTFAAHRFAPGRAGAAHLPVYAAAVCGAADVVVGALPAPRPR